MEKTILHCDCNGFYASVECILRPELKNVPMAVCGNPENRHGIILAKNELAKKFNIKTAETVWSAKKKCSELALVQPHRELYTKYSKLINEIYENYTDMVEPFGIDESWLDVTASYKLFGDGKTIADTLRKRIKNELGLTISVGVSFNKIFAKLGSDYKKPDATTVINRNNFKSVVFPLPVSDLLYVGRNTAETFEKMGIKTIGDLARSDARLVGCRLGKIGAQLHAYANGLDDEPVSRADVKKEIKSVGNGITFKRDLTTLQDVKTALVAICDLAATRMRKNGVKCTGVHITVKYSDFKTVSRQKVISAPTYSAKDMYNVSLEIIQEINVKKPIRMITVTGINLMDAENAGVQLSLLGNEEVIGGEKYERLEGAIDAIREKYGSDSIQLGADFKNDLGL